MELNKYLDYQIYIDNLDDEVAWKELEKYKIKYVDGLAPVEALTLYFINKNQIGYLCDYFIPGSKCLLMAVKENSLHLTKYYLNRQAIILPETYYFALFNNLTIFKKINNYDLKLILTINQLPSDTVILQYLLQYYNQPDQLDCLNHILRLIFRDVDYNVYSKLNIKPIWKRQQGISPIVAIGDITEKFEVIDLVGLRLNKLDENKINYYLSLPNEDLQAELMKYGYITY
jgi:hypothetical protein